LEDDPVTSIVVRLSIQPWKDFVLQDGDARRDIALILGSALSVNGVPCWSNAALSHAV